MQQIKLADIQMKMEKRKVRVVSLSWSVGFRFLSKRENGNVRLSDSLADPSFNWDRNHVRIGRRRSIALGN